MEYEYSKKLKKVMKKKPGPIVRALVFLLLVIVVAGCIASYWFEKEDIRNQKENVQKFNSNGVVEKYSKLSPDYLSEPFYTNFDESIFYYFAVDKDSKGYIVAIATEDKEQYQELIDYTYSAEAKVPKAVTLKGMPTKIEEEMVQSAIEAYNIFWGSEEVVNNTFKWVLGDYYLDMTKEPTFDFENLGICLFVLVLFVFIYGLLVVKMKKHKKRRQATLDRFGSIGLREIDKEMNQPNTVYFKAQKLYFTNRYVISSISGFDVIALEDIAHVYGYAYGIYTAAAQSSVTVVTRDQIKHEIAFTKDNRKGKDLFYKIVDHMKQILPEIEYGFENDFFIAASTNMGIEVDSDNELGKGNVALGILGALLGALLGGVIWIVIGMLGFIAGIAGVAMMIFAMNGYRKLSGSLDKKGQIISLIIAFIMIFIANYTSYVLEYCKVFYDGSYSMNNLVSSIKSLPDLLSSTIVLGEFIRSLVIGYALSIWAGFSIIRSTFSS